MRKSTASSQNRPKIYANPASNRSFFYLNSGLLIKTQQRLLPPTHLNFSIVPLINPSASFQLLSPSLGHIPVYAPFHNSHIWKHRLGLNAESLSALPPWLLAVPQAACYCHQRLGRKSLKTSASAEFAEVRGALTSRSRQFIALGLEGEGRCLVVRCCRYFALAFSFLRNPDFR